MKRINTYGVTCALLAGIAGCGEQHAAATGDSVMQTRFPGQMTAGGGTSGEVIARAGGAVSGAYKGGTPGIPMGSGGNVGGTATGGTVQQPSPPSSGEIPQPGEPGKPVK